MSDLIGKIVVIKRNGADGPQFPLRTNECLFGRKPECDIRIQLPNVSQEHAVVRVDNDRKIKLINLSSCNQTLVNGKPISQVEVQHLDVFTISDRSFRFEFPSPVQKQAKEKSPKTHRRRSSTLGGAQQENKTPKMPTPRGSPRTPPTGGSLKENIHRLRRHSMPLQEEEEVLASPAADKTPFSMIIVNSEPQESVGGEHKIQRRSKRVSFGPVLSPEQFDKSLPSATPVRRGATPRRPSNSGDHSLIASCSSAKKRRSVIASPHTESIEEEDYCLDASENDTPKTQMHFPSKMESLEQDQVTHLVDTHELTSPLLEDTGVENTVQKSPTSEKCTKSLQRTERRKAESVAMEVDIIDTPKGCRRFSANQATLESATPKGNRRSFSRLEGKKIEPTKKDQVSQKSATPKECRQSSSSLEEDNVKATGPNQVVLEKDTPQRNRRSSMRLAGKSPTSLESKVTPPGSEENMDETILDSDDYTSDEEEAEGKIAIGKDKSTRLATPLRKEIEEGVKLQKTKKKMVTPLKTEIANGIRLRQTKKRLATPLRKEIIDGTSLRQTKMKMATPLLKEIKDRVKLQKTKKKITTPLKKEITDGVRLRQTKKRLATPLKKEIIDGISLRQTKKKLATPLKKEITEGITLRETKKKLKTPIRKAIEDGVTLRVTKKKLSTPLKKAIQAKPQLRQTKKTMNSLLQNEIKQGSKLRKTKQTLPLEVQIEIIKGKQLRPTKKSLPTPLKKAISGGVTLRKTKKSLPTPLKDQIKRGALLQKTKKSLPTPVRRQLEEGVALKQTVKSSKSKRSEVGVEDSEPKRLKTSPSKGVTETDEISNVAPVRRALKTPLRKAIVAGTRLRATRQRMATPLRKQIHSKHVLRAVRRKSAVITVPEKTVPRKPTYAEIVKRPKKRASQGPSFKFGKTAKVFSKAIPPAKIADATLTNPEIPKVVQSKDRRNSTHLAGKNTPQTKSTKSTNSKGNEKTQKNWMSSLARATNGVKTRATSVEDLEGLSEMFATPPAVQINSNSFPKRQKSDNWLSSLAKATNGPRKRCMPVEDLEGVPEMFVTPPPTNAVSDQNKRSSTKSSLRSTDEKAMAQIMNVTPRETLEVKAEAASPNDQELHMTESLKPTRTPSLRSSAKDTEILEIVTPIRSSRTPSLRSGKKPTAKTAVTLQATLEIEEVLKPKKTPSLRNSAEDAITVQVVTPVQPSRTPSLRSAKTQSCVLTSECSDLELEFVEPIPPNKTPSIRSSAQMKAVLRKSVGNPSEDRKSLGLQGLTRLMKSPKENNAVENVEDSFVPNMFASPKPQPKRYSRKSEGFQGVARLMRTPDAKNEVAVESPKLNGIKTMMLPEKTLASPNFVGLRNLMKTPKTCEKHVNAEEHFSSELFASPVDNLPQVTAKSTASDRKDEKLSSPVIIDLTSPKTEATTAKRAKNIDSQASRRTTRAKRKAPEDSVEPVSKRGRHTRGTVKQRIEDKTETQSKPKAAQRKSTTRSKKTTAAVIQSTPKPFVFKRTQLDPIIEVPSPLPSFDDPDVAEKASNEARKTRSVTETKSQSKAPLRSSRRGNRAKAKAETSLEESSEEEVAEKCIATRSKKNEGFKEGTYKPGDTQKVAVEITEPKADGKRATRSTKVKGTQLNDDAPPIKTRATRSQRVDVEDKGVNSGPVEASVTNQTTRRSRRVAKTIEESVQVLGEARSTRSSGRKETRDKTADIGSETRSSRKPADNSKVVEKDNLTQSTRGKNCKKDEVKELDKEVKPKEIEPRSTRRTRGNSAAEKPFPEGDSALLQEKKEVRPDNSAKKSRAKRELKGKAEIKPRETRSTRSAKPVEDEVEFTEQPVRGTKRSRQDGESVAPKSKRTRSSAQTQSVNTRQTRSSSRK